jgi:hypothetical protein
MSHLNPNLYKRLGLLDLDYVLNKGKSMLSFYVDLYKYHLEEIREEVARGRVCEFTFNGQFKNKKCFYLEPRNAGKISDIGTVLSYLSAEEGLMNLAVLVMKKY